MCSHEIMRLALAELQRQRAERDERIASIKGEIEWMLTMQGPDDERADRMRMHLGELLERLRDWEREDAA